MMKYIDIKVTVWNRMVLEESANLEQIISELKSNGTGHVINGIREWEEVLTLWDSEELLSPEENNQCATLQVWDDNNLVWDNEVTETNFVND